MTQIWDDVVKRAAAANHAVCVLFPNERSVSLSTFMTRLPVTCDGVHVVALDGTWTSANRMAKQLPPDVPLVTVSSPYLYSLFQPLRRQPMPGRISTCEAIACAVDDVVSQWPMHSDESTPAASTATMVEGASSASVLYLDAAGPAHVHDVLLPTVSSYAGRLMRYNLCVLVDNLSRQTGMVGVDKLGAGYRTWNLPSSEVGARLGSLPAWILEHIAGFAYGRGAVAASGYKARRAEHVVEWKTVMAATADDAGGASTESVGAASTGGKQKVRSADWAANRTERVRLSRGHLPPSSRYTSTALAMTNSHVYCLAAGHYKLTTKRTDRAERRHRADHMDTASADQTVENGDNQATVVGDAPA